MAVTAKDFGKVAVLMGGASSEREISLLSGQNVVAAMLEKGIDAYGIDVGIDIVKRLQTDKPDRVFNAIHGHGGEDGVIQSILDILAIPYACSGAAASALTFHKHYSKSLWQACNLPILPFMIIDEKSDTKKIVQQYGLPLCVKPVSNGSSCGVSKVTTARQLLPAYKKALQYSAIVMVEPWITGHEFTVGIVGEEVLPIIEITTPLDFYNYEAKYLTNSTDYICPPDLSAIEQSKLQKLALRAFQTANCCCFARVDFLQDKTGKFWLLEVNTVPGLTAHSLIPKAAKQMGIDFPELIWNILEFTL